MVQINAQRAARDGDSDNDEQYLATGDESRALEVEEDQVDNQGNDLLKIPIRNSDLYKLFVYANYTMALNLFMLVKIYFVVDKEVGKRKGTALPIVWNMPSGHRIVVKCNEESQPIGDEGAILGKFLGTIARNGGYCQLNINDWREVKKNGGDETILQCVEVIHS